jgi:hypothetical protein
MIGIDRILASENLGFSQAPPNFWLLVVPIFRKKLPARRLRAAIRVCNASIRLQYPLILSVYSSRVEGGDSQ